MKKSSTSAVLTDCGELSGTTLKEFEILRILKPSTQFNYIRIHKFKMKSKEQKLQRAIFAN